MIEHRIQGIPCQLEVTHFFEQKPMGSRADSDWDCYGYTEIEYEVRDRRGRIAPWLESKMTESDRDAAEQAIKDARGSDYDGDDGSYDGDY